MRERVAAADAVTPSEVAATGGLSARDSPVVAEATRRARAAQQQWARVDTADRCAVIDRARAALLNEIDTLADLLVEAVPARSDRAEALSGELMPMLAAARWLSRCGAKVLRTRRTGWWTRPSFLPGHRAEVRRRALGVVLIIAPSNYPLMLPGVQAMQALAAGNAVAIKPAPGSGVAVQRFAACLRQAGLPSELLAVLGESAGEAQAAIAAGVDHVVLTGSFSTGRAVQAQLTPRLTPSTMELSGCDACFVLPDATDAQIDRAVDALAFGLTYNGSQTCIAPRRVHATPAMATTLAQRVAGRLADTVAVPVPSAVAGRLAELIADATRRGATRLTGDVWADPDQRGTMRVEPVLMTEVPADASLLAADLFAPWLAFVPCLDANAMLAANARCPYKLGASIFGPSHSANDLADALDVGSVTINDLIVPTADPRLPFPAVGHSGFGVTRGPEGLLAMTRPMVITEHRGPTPRHYQTDTPGLDSLLTAMLRMHHAPSLGGRAAGLRDFARSIYRVARATSSSPNTSSSIKDS
ncbi:MAG: aldehyde dehydrogenase family protein [Planctomycetota bacterium]